MTDLQALALEEATLKALLDEVTDRYKTVRADYQTAIEDAAKVTGAAVSKVIPQLPDGTKVATISSRGSGDSIAEIDDPAAFLKWALANAQTEIKREIVTTVREAYVTKILGQMTAAGTNRIVDADGVITEVPGVSVRPRRSRNHAIRFAKGGREAIINAWRDGTLGIDPVRPREVEA